MSINILDMNTLWHNGFASKPIAGTSLRGGMPLGTVDLPEMAASRASGADAKLSFHLTMAAVKVMQFSEITATEFVGVDGESTPMGVKFKSKEKGMPLWATAIYKTDKSSKVLRIAGSPFSTAMFNFYGGIGLAAYMMLNYKAYPDYMASVRNVIQKKAAGDAKQLGIAYARMSDEMTVALENMINKKDPTGISGVELASSEEMVDLESSMTSVFKGGNMIEAAFKDEKELDKFINTKVKISSIDSVIYGDDVIPTKFIGELPKQARDLIRRGKHILLTGPTATGKTSAIDDVCIHEGYPQSYIGGSPGLEDRDLIGSMVPDGKGGWKFSYGPLTEALLNGKKQYELYTQAVEKAKQDGTDPNVIIPVPAVLMVDEINRLEPRHQNVFISLLNERPDNNGGKHFYFRVPDTNEELTCPVGFLVLIGARNFGTAYVGSNDMDLALERRFHQKIDVWYLDKAVEETLLNSRVGLDKKLCKVLAKVANDSRNQMTQLRAPIDTDTLLRWAEELAYISNKGVVITDKVVLDLASRVVFDIVLERSDRGTFEESGVSILTDNINEAYKEVFKSK